MTPACRAFRTLLERKLVGRPDPSSLTVLSWHEHLLGCADCRRLLEGEEALESLLATLPEPNLAPEIKRRVLVALARSRAEDVALDALLERDADSAVPSGLAHQILARLDAERRLAHASASVADRLDALLDSARVVVPRELTRRTLARLATARAGAASTGDDRLDALLERAGQVDVPHALDRRVLAGLDAHRTATARGRFTLARPLWAYAAAALLVATLLAWTLWRKGEPAARPEFVDNGPSRSESHSNDTQLATAPDAQMLAALDVLENWDLLMGNDVDVLLSTIEPADEVLLDYQDEG